MLFTETRLAGAYVMDLTPHEDARGFFARTFCQREFADHGLKPVIAQSSIASNRRKGTVRGMHFQYPPVAETKIVRCTRGALFDVMVDLRPESPTYLQHVSVELTADNYRAIYVPERCAHGFQVLHDNTDVSYQIGEFYAPGADGGLRHDDPRLGIAWPLAVSLISDKDRRWPLLSDIEPLLRSRMAAQGNGGGPGYAGCSGASSRTPQVRRTSFLP